jgi:hypothetical protein
MHFSPSSLVLLGLTVVNLVNGDDIIFNDPKSRVPAVPKILSATASGSGCPQGTTDFLTQPDGVDYLEFMHRNFSAIAGGGAAPRIVSKNCEVHLSLDAGTPGWQAALGKLTVLGEASVAPNATFTAYVTSYWSFTANDRVSGTELLTVEYGTDRDLGHPEREFHEPGRSGKEWRCDGGAPY